MPKHFSTVASLGDGIYVSKDDHGPNNFKAALLLRGHVSAAMESLHEVGGFRLLPLLSFSVDGSYYPVHVAVLAGPEMFQLFQEWVKGLRSAGLFEP